MTSTSLLSYARRLGAALVSLLVLGLVASLVALAPPPAGAATTSLSARPAVAGERLVLTGSVPATRARPVTLQRRAAARWVRVAGARTTARGAFRFVVRQPSVATAYRVLAPAVAGRRATVQPCRPGRPGRPARHPHHHRAAGGTEPARGARRLRAGPSGPPVAGGATGRRPVAGRGRRHPAALGPDHRRGAHPPHGRAVRRPGHRSRLARRGRRQPPVTVDVQAVAPRRVGAPRLVTVGPGGAVGDTAPGGAGTSDGGRWVTFESDATNLVPGLNGDATQVYLRDTRAGTTTRISSAPDGGPGDGYSYDPVISGDGRYVSFTTTAMLLPNDTNRTLTESSTSTTQAEPLPVAGDRLSTARARRRRHRSRSRSSQTRTAGRYARVLEPPAYVDHRRPRAVRSVRLDRRTGTPPRWRRTAPPGRRPAAQHASPRATPSMVRATSSAPDSLAR